MTPAQGTVPAGYSLVYGMMWDCLRVIPGAIDLLCSQRHCDVPSGDSTHSSVVVNCSHSVNCVTEDSYDAES